MLDIGLGKAGVGLDIWLDLDGLGGFGELFGFGDLVGF